MSVQSRRELLHAISGRYRAAYELEKGQILDEFIASTKYNRKYAMSLLNGPTAASKERRPRTSKHIYTQEVQRKRQWRSWTFSMQPSTSGDRRKLSIERTSLRTGRGVSGGPGSGSHNSYERYDTENHLPPRRGKPCEGRSATFRKTCTGWTIRPIPQYCGI